MRQTITPPRRVSLEGAAAGRNGRALGSFPRVSYHPRGDGARGRRVRLYVDTPQGRRCAGVLVRDSDGRPLLRRVVDFERHLLRVPEEGWAVDAAVLAQGEAAGAVQVEVLDERGRRWWCSMADFARFGQRLDRGHGEQVLLPLRWWSFHPGPMRAIVGGGLEADGDHD